MKMFENSFLGEECYFEAALPNLINATAELSEIDKTKLAKYWSCRPPTVLGQIVRSIQSLITYRVSLIKEDELVNDDLIIENAVKVLRVVYYASLLGGDREKKLLTSEVVDTAPCSTATSTASSIVTLPDENGLGRPGDCQVAIMRLSVVSYLLSQSITKGRA